MKCFIKTVGFDNMTKDYEKALRAVEDGTDSIASVLVEELEKVTKGASTVPFTFEKEVSSVMDEIAVSAFTREDFYNWHDNGTKERYALMNPDKAINKRGKRTALVGKNAFAQHNLAPMPGIPAKHFTDRAWEAAEPKVDAIILKMIEKAKPSE